jgi:hypothetical protein
MSVWLAWILTAGSAANNAMTTLVSSKTLPATRIDLLAAVLDRLLHGFQISGIY